MRTLLILIIAFGVSGCIQAAVENDNNANNVNNLNNLNNTDVEIGFVSPLQGAAVRPDFEVVLELRGVEDAFLTIGDENFVCDGNTCPVSLGSSFVDGPIDVFANGVFGRKDVEAQSGLRLNVDRTNPTCSDRVRDSWVQESVVVHFEETMSADTRNVTLGGESVSDLEYAMSTLSFSIPRALEGPFPVEFALEGMTDLAGNPLVDCTMTFREYAEESFDFGRVEGGSYAFAGVTFDGNRPLIALSRFNPHVLKVFSRQRTGNQWTEVASVDLDGLMKDFTWLDPTHFGANISGSSAVFMFAGDDSIESVTGPRSPI